MGDDGEAIGLQQNDLRSEVVQRDADGLAEVAVRRIADEADAALANALDRERRGVQNAILAGINGDAFFERRVGANAEREETDPQAENGVREEVDERVGGLRMSDQRHWYMSGRFEIAGIENEERSHRTLGVWSDFSQPRGDSNDLSHTLKESHNCTKTLPSLSCIGSSPLRCPDSNLGQECRYHSKAQSYPR